MRQKNIGIHELPYTEMVKFGTIRLASYGINNKNGLT